MRLARFFLSNLLLAAPLAAEPTPAPPPMDGALQARNKAVAARVFEEIFNQGRFEVADAIYAPGFHNHGLKRDVDLRADQDAVHAEKRAFDAQAQAQLLEGDDAEAQLGARGELGQDLEPGRGQQQHFAGAQGRQFQALSGLQGLAAAGANRPQFQACPWATGP